MGMKFHKNTSKIWWKTFQEQYNYKGGPTPIKVCVLECYVIKGHVDVMASVTI